MMSPLMEAHTDTVAPSAPSNCGESRVMVRSGKEWHNYIIKCTTDEIHTDSKLVITICTHCTFNILNVRDSD